MTKRTKEETQAYVDGYNACFKKFRETLLLRNVGTNKAIRKMEMLKEAVNSVLLTENTGKQTDGDLISRQAVIQALKDNVVEIGGEEYNGLGVCEEEIESIVNNIPSAEKTTE